MVEMYPREIVELRERQQQALEELEGPAEPELRRFLLAKSRTWIPGSTVRVAFHGLHRVIYKEIEEVIHAWAEAAHLDLRTRGEDGRILTWSTEDLDYRAEIRITFGEVENWSLLGWEAIDPSIAGPGKPSMSLAGFENGLPPGYRAIVLHEFGHALGFLHEHQHPSRGCRGEIRWDPDPGYEAPPPGERVIPDREGRSPGLYAWLKGPPYGLSVPEIHHNMLPRVSGEAYPLDGVFDPESVMRYFLPPWVLREPSGNCFGQLEPELSPGDKSGAKRAYPSSPIGQQLVLKEKQKVCSFTESDDEALHGLRDHCEAVEAALVVLGT